MTNDMKTFGYASGPRGRYEVVVSESGAYRIRLLSDAGWRLVDAPPFLSLRNAQRECQILAGV